jgi:hypothetical protein
MQIALVKVSCTYPGSLYNAITIGSAYDLMPKSQGNKLPMCMGVLYTLANAVVLVSMIATVEVFVLAPWMIQ